MRATSARPSAGRFAVPMKMTSSIRELRNARVLWAPRTQVTASTTLDLPDPLGPTTAVTPGLELQNGGVSEGLEALHRQTLKKHALTLATFASKTGPYAWHFAQKNVPRPRTVSRRIDWRHW